MELGQVFTKENVANYMASLFSLDENSNILDPCFGEGSFLKAAILCGFKNIKGYEIDTELYNYTKQNYPFLSLYENDFLEVSSDEKFDGIIMNPPYIRQEKIDNLEPLGITKKKIRENPIFKFLSNTSNLYMYFTIKAINLLKEKGELIVIFPSSWQQAKTGKKFEHLLYENCTLLRQIHITGEVFEKEALVEVVILHLKKGKFNIKNDEKHLEAINGDFIEKKNAMFNMNGLDYNESFSDIGTVRRGLTTGYNTMYMNPPFANEESNSHLSNIISSPKSIKGYGTSNAKLDSIFLPCENNEINNEVKNYIQNWKRKIIKDEKPKTLLKKIKSNNQSWYILKAIESEGLLFSYFVRNDMKFILNNGGYLVRDNFYIIKPKLDDYLAFALLNNYYTYLQLELSGKKYGAGLLKIQRYDIEELKFPNVDLFSVEDKNKLKNLSKSLIRSGDIESIEKITKIIEKYSGIKFDTIKKKYFTIKRQRLKGEFNET